MFFYLIVLGFMRWDLNASVAGDSLCNSAGTPNGILLPELPKYGITGTHHHPWIKDLLILFLNGNVWILVWILYSRVLLHLYISNEQLLQVQCPLVAFWFLRILFLETFHLRLPMKEGNNIIIHWSLINARILILNLSFNTPWQFYLCLYWLITQNDLK